MRKKLLAGISLLAITGIMVSCGPRKFCNNKMEKRIEKYADRFVKKLALNKDQQREYDSLKADMKTFSKKQRKERQPKIAQLRKNLQSNTVDIDAIILDLDKGRDRNKPQILAFRKRFIKLYKSLNETQKKIVHKKLDKMLYRFDCK